MNHAQLFPPVAGRQHPVKRIILQQPASFSFFRHFAENPQLVLAAALPADAQAELWLLSHSHAAAMEHSPATRKAIVAWVENVRTFAMTVQAGAQPLAAQLAVALRRPEVRAALREVVRPLRNEVGALRNEVGALRNEVGAVRNDLGAVRNDLGALSNRVDAIGNHVLAGQVRAQLEGHRILNRARVLRHPPLASLPAVLPGRPLPAAAAPLPLSWDEVQGMPIAHVDAVLAYWLVEASPAAGPDERKYLLWSCIDPHRP